jgi:hypothetical protein
MALTQVAGGMLLGGITSSQISSVSGASLTGTQNIPKATLPTGSVLQVVQATSTTNISSTGNADLLTASITPSSASNKVLVTGFFTVNGVPSSNSYVTGYLYRGTSGGTQVFYSYIGITTTTSTVSQWYGSVLDSPSTTSSQTYTMTAGKGSGGTASWNTADIRYSIILMEISA